MAGIKSTPQQFTDYIAKKQEAKIKALTAALDYVGMECVAEMRSHGRYNDYTDRTGNLRSSTGYVVAKDGRIVKGSAFSVVNNGGTGHSEGKAVAKEAANTVGKTQIGLVLVAGMDYAEYVEKKRNVMASAIELAESETQKYLSKLGFKLNKVDV